MIELLVIKCKEQYIRVRDGYYELTSLEKASVFPLTKIAVVKDHLIMLKKEHETLSIRKLTITESDFEDN